MKQDTVCCLMRDQISDSYTPIEFMACDFWIVAPDEKIATQWTVKLTVIIEPKKGRHLLFHCVIACRASCDEVRLDENCHKRCYYSMMKVALHYYNFLTLPPKPINL